MHLHVKGLTLQFQNVAETLLDCPQILRCQFSHALIEPLLGDGPDRVRDRDDVPALVPHWHQQGKALDMPSALSPVALVLNQWVPEKSDRI